jgi:hypothetical protein
VAPSTPAQQDYRLHVRAWQHHFAAIFGVAALGRVRGFSPAEMALPNHPDVCYKFVKTLRECGYHWMLVQEHTVEFAEHGGPIGQAHIPHRLVARNSRGETISIIAIVKTQGSDTKLVSQMQPYYEAMPFPCFQHKMVRVKTISCSPNAYCRQRTIKGSGGCSDRWMPPVLSSAP